jgi:hypothetical protein
MWDILQGQKYRETRRVVADPSVAYPIRCVERLLSVDTAAFYNDSGPWGFRRFRNDDFSNTWAEGSEREVVGRMGTMGVLCRNAEQ